MRRTFRTGDFQPDPDRDFQEEAGFHIDMMVEDLMAAGLSRQEATEEAQRRFGNMQKIRRDATGEESRRQRRLRIGDRLDTLRQDIGYGLRTLLRSPGMTFLRGTRLSPVVALRSE